MIHDPSKLIFAFSTERNAAKLNHLMELLNKLDSCDLLGNATLIGQINFFLADRYTPDQVECLINIIDELTTIGDAR